MFFVHKPTFFSYSIKMLVPIKRDLVYLTYLIFRDYNYGGVAERLKATVC